LEISTTVTTPTISTPQKIDPSPVPSEGKELPMDEDEIEDYTRIPAEMEKKFEYLDEDSALRPTIINPGDTWTKKYQKSLLTAPTQMTLSTEEQGKERNKAFDLLDALSKSGALSIDQVDLHVVIAATHCFTQTIMNTIIQGNVNPIEKVERSSLIVASTIQHVEPAALISPDHLNRVGLYSPQLLK